MAWKQAIVKGEKNHGRTVGRLASGNGENGFGNGNGRSGKGDGDFGNGENGFGNGDSGRGFGDARGGDCFWVKNGSGQGANVSRDGFQEDF